MDGGKLIADKARDALELIQARAGALEQHRDELLAEVEDLRRQSRSWRSKNPNTWGLIAAGIGAGVAFALVLLA